MRWDGSDGAILNPVRHLVRWAANLWPMSKIGEPRINWLLELARGIGVGGLLLCWRRSGTTAATPHHAGDADDSCWHPGGRVGQHLRNIRRATGRVATAGVCRPLRSPDTGDAAHGRDRPGAAGPARPDRVRPVPGGGHLGRLRRLKRGRTTCTRWRTTSRVGNLHGSLTIAMLGSWSSASLSSPTATGASSARRRRSGMP